jgi:hypothetical protein
MSKLKICFVFGFFIFVFCFKISSVYAAVVINEVQIGGASGSDEFIELYNSGNTDVDLTSWFLKKKTSSGAEYSLVATNRLEGKTISAGGYFLLGNEGGYTGSTQLDATWASSNTIASNNQVVLYSLSDLVDSVSIGSVENGKSYQKFDSGWSVANPTPKAQNQQDSNNGSGGSGNNSEDDSNDSGANNSGNNNSNSSSGSSSEKSKPKIIPTYKVKMLVADVAFAGQQVEFGLDVKYGDKTYAVGKYFWNFGDGESKELIGGFEKFTHTFYYPGEYNVSLEYFARKDGALADITVEKIIKVVPLDIYISDVGDQKDFFVELTNESDNKINISNWVLSSGNKNFVIPKNTFIAANNFLTISGRTSGFVFGDEKYLKLIMPTGEVAFDFNSKSVPVKRVADENVYSEEENTENKITTEKDSGDKQNLIKEKDLTSASILSEEGSSIANYWVIIMLGAFMLVGAVTVYIIRRNGFVAISKNSEDFEAIDE